MNQPASRPGLVAIAVALLAGVALSEGLGPWSSAWPAWWSCALLAAAIARGRRALWLFAAFAAGGGAAACDRVRAEAPDPATARVTLRGVVEAPVEPWAGGVRFRFAADSGLAVDVTLRDPVAGPLPGDRLALRGRLRGPRGYRNPGSAGARRRALAARGAVASMSVARADVEELGVEFSPWRLPVQARRRLSATIAARGGDAEGNALARAMALGERGRVPDPAQARFRDAGIAHLLAVSGLHVGAVALLLLWITRRTWAAVPALATRVDPGWVAALVAGGGAVFYTLVTGARTSTLRAMVVVLVLLLGSALCRRARFVHALALAAIALVATAPSIVFEPSFQLSFTAALSLALLPRAAAAGEATAPRSRAARATAWLGQSVLATAWVTAATAPIVAHWFGALPTAAVPANLVAVPASELGVLPLALVGSLVAELWPAAGGLLIDGAVALAGAVDDVAGALASTLPPVSVPAPSTLELVAWYAAMAAVLAARRRWLAPRVGAIGVAVAAAVLAISLGAERTPPPDLRITFVDVGQGDAALVELPGGAVWLIDAGGLPFVARDVAPERRRALGAMPGERALLPLLRHRGIDRVDRVILSHPHPDHFRGLGALEGRIELGELWLARGSLTPDGELGALVERLGVPVVHPPRGRRLDAGHGVGLTVLAPRYGAIDAEVDPVMSVNDNSLVVRIDRAGRSVLFTGDLELEGEAELVASGHAAADVIKVPHHGSNTSSTPALVAAVSPEIAVVSCGEANRFGFPAAEVIERWQRAGARVLRTDRSGAIAVRIGADGQLLVQPFDP